MTDLRTTPPAPTSRRPSTTRLVARWTASFVAYPAGGYLAVMLVGRIDGVGPALAGGLLTGAVVGATQAWAMGQVRPPAVWWVAATTIGMMAGVALGSALVGQRTDLSSLVLQGLVSGSVVGLAQAAVLRPRLGTITVLWPPLLGGTFAVGWLVTTLAGIDVDQQFTVFGSSGALVATAVTSVLPVALWRIRSRSWSPASTA